MFQFAKFEKSKERRLATELGYGFPIGDPWITDEISPWPFASESVLPSQCPGIHPMHSFLYSTTSILLDSEDDSISSDRLIVFLARSFTSWLLESFDLQSPNGGSI
ncbi:putative mitochondrial protein [Cucumis melo var. makuwa]|uniref:Mitochondrial protein n=1 Tax=Cucumis melo var. makuwa TaxID=1194695 RepID=A0A5D3DWU4_CUCMM|nr:putative mitochondrial protein [Cucumis melo var. makuwa]TYK27992.1 putative mitochondrial protein [Cucumis melo var. makuwa]